MTNSEIVETLMKDSCTANPVNNLHELSVQKFYNPLSVTGYLTPLQRKKLREKRNDISPKLGDSSAKEVKKARAVKRKKSSNSAQRDKNIEVIKRIRTRDNIQQMQYTVSKIVHKTTDGSNKTKKFFKSSASDRLDKANFTMPLVFKKNVFLSIDRCVKETLAHTKKLSQHKTNITCHRSSPEVFDHAEDLELKNIVLLQSEKENLDENNMSSSLVEKSEIFRHSNSTIPQHESLEQVSIPDTKELLFEFNWPSDEELLKRREKARELAKKQNVLREANNIHKYTDMENENKEQNTDGNQVKFYPVFHFALKKQSRINETKKRLQNGKKKIKVSSTSSEQMIIDAGQKEIGPKICSICNMMYTVGQEEDEKLHSNYHNLHVTNLKFPGWKEENLIGEYCDGRVIMIQKSDKNFMLKKVEDVLHMANRDLGFPSPAIPVKPDLTFLLFISNEKVVGCIVAEPISKAFQVMLTGDGSTPNNVSKEKFGKVGNWCSSLDAVPAICGVNRIWVDHNFRRQKVASRMLDCLRCHFIHGHVIGIREIAFTDPSPDGQQFASGYTGTANFLVYK